MVEMISNRYTSYIIAISGTFCNRFQDTSIFVNLKKLDYQTETPSVAFIFTVGQGWKFVSEKYKTVWTHGKRYSTVIQRKQPNQIYTETK